jgi:C1A family cysteine protease
LNATAGGWDWVEKGAVTKVKDQGQCGSCWSFGTTGDIEGVTFLKTGKLTSLSEQQLVACDKKQDQGCNGGLQEDAFVYVKNTGLTTEANYPYTSGKGKRGYCLEAKIKKPLQKIKGFTQISKTGKGEAGIKDPLTKNGPITIGIDASPMQDYKQGIDSPVNCSPNKGCGCTADSLDHAVLMVGYGQGQLKGSTVSYWKIKNSWNSDWGEEGYYRIEAGHNKCGLAMDAVHSEE